MNVSLYQAASAMNANARWQEIIAGNLASASVPGFKRRDLAFSAVQPESPQDSTVLARAAERTNFRSGEFRLTGVATDVAIDGKGFFVFQLPNGSNGYTRDGEFHVSAKGELVTKQGYPVLGENGPIHLDARNPNQVTVSSTGQISQEGETRGKLKVVDFSNPDLLKPISGAAFLANDPSVEIRDITDPSLRQGFLETANTTSVLEMANLIRVMRGFEANQKVVQLQDEQMGRAISELGNPVS